MQEKIGNILLDDTFYPGEDLYCDGRIEDDLLEIVQTKEQSEFQKVIEERADWPIFYHLSPMRENIVDWIPMDKDMKVLEVGSGCGAITGALARKAGSVTCIDLSMKRSKINAYRHQACDNILIHVGNFKDIEAILPDDYDYIMLIGVFEYAKGYMGSDTPYEDFMNILRKHLKPNGRLVIAIENKLGMKYFAGCREDHTGRFFDGIENYPNGQGVRTFTRDGLERIMDACNVEERYFFYPYPDYKFATTIFSDVRLPQKGELSNNIRNFDRDRILLFDEQKAFDTMIEEGMFPMYSNSFLVLIGPDVPVKYSKFSNDRAAEYAIRTDILYETTGNKEVRWVEKHPINESAQEHIAKLLFNFEKLSERFEGSGISFNQCKPCNGGITFEFIEGETLECLLDRCILKQDKEAFLALFNQFREMVFYRNEIPISDYDFIFPNIMVHDNCWTVIDYEWTFEERIEPQLIVERSIYCYLLGGKGRRVILQWLAEEIGSETILQEKMQKSEGIFQKYVTKGALASGEIRHIIGNTVWNLDDILEKTKGYVPQIQIFESYGEGFSPEHSYYAQDVRKNGKTLNFSIELNPNLTNIRIDPGDIPCIVKVESVIANDEDIIDRLLHTKRSGFRSHNGIRLEGNRYFFSTPDPHFAWNLKGLLSKETEIWKINLQITELEADTAHALQKQLGIVGKVKRKI